MNPMNDPRFFDLAMKVIGRQATEAERAELESLVASRSELKAEWERLQADARFTKEVLPLVAATESAASEFPSYARERLQTKVRQTLGRPERAERKAGWFWVWALGLATATAAVVLVFLTLVNRPPAAVIQVAMLDLAGATRGVDTNEVAALQQQWKAATVESFAKTGELEAWEKNWPAGSQPVVKVIYDRAAGEVRVVGRWKGKQFQKTFPVEGNLGTVLPQAQVFIREQSGR
jgi:hypothetical protein